MLAVRQSIRWTEQKLPLDEFISQYRKLYQDGIDLFAEFNPCRIHDNSCMRGRRDHGMPSSSFCCAGCAYLTPTGCSTDSIWCKLWTCGAMREETDKAFWNKRRELNSMANALCHGHGGRYGLDVYIKTFYGKEVLEEWRTTETKLKSISSQSAS